MQVLISIIPGVGFTCALFLFLISWLQYQVYRKKLYKRSKSIALFCFFAGIFALEQFVVQSQIFSSGFTHAFVGISSASFCLSLLFYLQSLSHFIAIPSWIYKFYTWSTSGLTVATLFGIFAYFFLDLYFFFNPFEVLETSNYFVNSYSSRIGAPSLYLTTILSLSGTITVFASVYILRVVLKSSQDSYFVLGLLVSIVAAIWENFLLPFTFTYFVPLIFMSNLFEAFRMHSLAYREYLKESHSSKKVLSSSDAEKYQNSSLTEDRILELAKTITSVFERDKLYMNPNLNSEDLAKKVGIPSYQLSQVVNIGLNTTFFELLSLYRIENVKKKLKDESLSDETIINIAYGSGFNSKSAFNTAFKKQTGVTPSVFRKT